MNTHDYDIIAYEVMRLEEEDVFPIAVTCERRGTGKAKDIKWSSDDESIIKVDKNGIVTAVGQGSATVTARLGKKSESCLFYVINRKFPFVDVKEEYWYYEPVDFVRRSHLMNGLSKNIFGPTELLSRAQFSVILHRLADGPAMPYEKIFYDVPDEEWYTSAILWVNKVGIANGYAGTDLFGTDDPISREQMAVMLYRYAKYRQYDISETVELDQFADYKSVGKFAIEAFQWAVGSGIISGRENGTKLDPQGSANRAESAAIIMRFVKKYE